MTDAAVAGPEQPAYDLQSGVVELRPLGFTDILDGSFAVFRAAKWVMVPVVCALMIPLQLLVAFTQREALSFSLTGMLDDPAAAELILGDGTVTPGLAITLAGQVVVVPLLAGALAHAAAGTMRGYPPELGATAAATARRAGWLIGAYVGCGLARLSPLLLVAAALAAGSEVGVVVAVFVTMVVAIGLTPLFAVITPALMSLDRPAPAAIGHAIGLCRRAYWRTAGVMLGTTVVFNLLALLLAGIPNAIGLLAGLGYGWVLVAFASVLAQLIVAPLNAAAMVLLHADLRVRQEGMDFDRVIQQLSVGVRGP